MASYGLSYMGSKSKIAHKIAPLFPKAKTFVDLFAGGGAITHYLMTTRKYHHFIFNDINPLMPKAFEMALNGEFEKETRWISREDFFRLRDTDPYAAICFSFGNNLSNYMYNKDIEPIKEAYHYAIFFGDYSLAKERIGIDLTPLEKCATIEDKYALLKRIVKSTPPFSRNKVAVGRESVANQRCDLQNLERLQRLRKIYNPQRRFSVPELPPPNFISKTQKEERAWLTLGGTASDANPKRRPSDVVEFYNTDYQNVPIPQDSVVYCDPPYVNTAKYQAHKKSDFDYDRFYEWAEKQEQPIFISEYWMPEDRFTCVAEIKRTSSFSQTNNSLLALEKVFVPKNQHSKITTNSQLTLFD